MKKIRKDIFHPECDKPLTDAEMRRLLELPKMKLPDMPPVPKFPKRVCKMPKKKSVKSECCNGSNFMVDKIAALESRIIELEGDMFRMARAIDEMFGDPIGSICHEIALKKQGLANEEEGI